MIILTIYPSKNEYKYKIKSNALRDIRSNGLKSYQYSLVDKENHTTFMQGLWLTKQEMNTVANFKTISRGIRYIRYSRKKNRRN